MYWRSDHVQACAGLTFREQQFPLWTQYGATLSDAKPQFTWTRGETPRYFTLDPTGKFLFVLNQNTNNIVTFTVNALTGDLKFVNEFVGNASPACMLFL